MKAIVMAGGEGTRLRPLTCGTPKPMVPLLDRPMLDYAIEHLLRYGISDMAFTLGYQPSVITGYFEDHQPKDAYIEYYIEDVPLGTAGSVKNAAGFVDGTFIILSGDALTDIDLKQAVDAHRRSGAKATIVLKKMGNPSGYGVVITNADGFVERFVEKPGWEDVFSDTINTGLYVLEPDVLELVPQGQSFDFAKDLFPLMMNKGMPIYGHVASGYWCDVGNIESYIRAHEDMLKGAVSVNIKGRCVGGIWVGTGVTLSSSALIQSPGFIGEGVTIGDGAKIGRYSCIGAYAHVGAFSNLKRSVMHSGARVGRHAKLSGCVVASRSSVGERASVYEGAVVGEGCTLAGDSRVSPRVRIWPDKNIGYGTSVGENIVWGHGERTGLIGKTGFVGDVGVDLTPLKLGRIFGAIGEFMSGKSVAVCADGSAISHAALKQASGILTMSGVNVFALSGVTRSACALVADIMQNGLCLMIRMSKQHLYVDIFEPELFMLSKNARRQIEARYFMQGEMLASTACGKETWVGAAESLYTNTVFQKIDWSTIKASGIRVLVVGGRETDAFAVRVMETCGIRIADAGGMDAETAMHTHGASFGVRFAKDGMVSALYLPSGRILGPDEWKALSYYLVFSSLNKPVVNLPSGVSRSVVAAADVLNISYEFTSEEDAVLDLSPDQRRVLYDGVFGICRFAEHMARSGVMADEVAAVIEQPHIRVKAISCDYDDIGRVIGGMYARGGAYANEGLRVDVQGGSGYICPHATRPTIIIRTEGDTEEFAEELCETYTDMVRRIVRQSKKS